MVSQLTGLSLLRRCFAFLILCGGVASGLGQTASLPTFDSLAQAAAAERDAGQPQDSIRDYMRALELKPDWAEGWWYLGTLQYDAKRFPQAQDAFQKVVALLPSMGAAWNFLGLCNFETRDYEAARSNLEKGQALGAGDDPDIAQVAAYHLALLRIKSGEFEQASALLQASFPGAQTPDQIRDAFGLALLRIPLLPAEIDPSNDAMIHAAGEAAAAGLKVDAVNAIGLLTALVRNNPQTPYLHYALGNALAADGQDSEALNEQREETRISPESPLPWAQISTLELRLKNPEASHRAAERTAALAGDHGQIEARIVHLYAVRTSGTLAGDAQWRDAMRAYSGGQYSEAAASLKQWLQSKPNDGTAWAVLGLSEFELEEYDNALLHLQRGRDLGFGGSAEAVQLANYRLGLLLNRSSQFENASAVLTSPADSGPLAKEVQFALGMALLRMPHFPEAVDASLRPIVQTAGETATLLHTSRYDQAFANFESMLRLSPDLPFLHYAYGTALIALSRYDAAEEQMRAELRISPNSPLPYVRLASIAIRQHEPANALPMTQQAIKLAPDSAEAHYLLGRACLESGQDDTAVRELEIAAKIAPNSPEIHFNLAKAYTRARMPEKAEQERAAFARLNALAEQQRSQTGNQSYEGPRESSDLPATAPH